MVPASYTLPLQTVPDPLHNCEDQQIANFFKPRTGQFLCDTRQFSFFFPKYHITICCRKCWILHQYVLDSEYG